MKAKFKAVVAAAALTVSGAASAGIDNGWEGNGELFLSVWDEVTGLSYTRDLGIHVDDFSAAPGGLIAADTYLQNFISAAGANPLKWNVGGVSNFDATFSNVDSYGVYITGADGFAPVQGTTSLQVQNAILNGRNFADSLNSLTGFTDSVVNETHTVDVAVQGDSRYAGGTLWGNSMGGQLPFNTTSLLGQTLAFYHINFDWMGDFSNIAQEFTGNWELRANGDLEFSPVPLPPAFWLLASAMIGLVGVARRRKESLA